MGRTVMPGGKSGAAREEARASRRAGRSALKNGMGRSRGLVRGMASFKCTSRGAGVLREVSGEGLGAAGATMEDGEEQRLSGRMGWGGEEEEVH